MGGTRDLNPNLAAAARERAPRSVGEGNKRLSVRLQSRGNTTRRDLCRDNRYITQEQEGSNSAASSAHPSPVEDANGDPEGLVLGPRAAVAVRKSLPRGQNVRGLRLRRLAAAAPCRRDVQDRVLHHLIALVEAIHAAERPRRHAITNAYAR